MAFRKAKSEQAFLKMGIYGPAGSGKTFTSLLIAEGLTNAMGKRVAFVDTESGTDFYTQTIEERPIHPEAFDFDRIVTKSLAQTNQEVDGIDPSEHGIVVIDSISHLWEAAIEAYDGKKTSIGSIPMHAWGGIKKPYKALITTLLNGQYHAIICGRQKNVFGEDDASGEMRLLGVAMKAEGETPYEPHVLVRMIRELGRGKSLAPVSAFVEKDRSGILSGRTIVLPADQPEGFTYEQIAAPLLAVLLGKKQPQVESIEIAASRDAESKAESDAVKRTSSAELLRTYLARFELCGSVEDVERVSLEITPALKKTMLPADVAGLRVAYQDHTRRVKGSA